VDVERWVKGKKERREEREREREENGGKSKLVNEIEKMDQYIS